jgi:hypothetical protein
MTTILPKNLQLIAQRLANFHRTTVRTRAQSNDQAAAGQTVTFRLPTNTLVDLHNLQLTADLQISSTVSTSSSAAMLGGPRQAQALIERLDVVINGQVVNGSNNDYGGLVSLATNHLSCPQRKSIMAFLESTDEKFDQSYGLNVRNGTLADNYAPSQYNIPQQGLGSSGLPTDFTSMYWGNNNSSAYKPLNNASPNNAAGYYTVPIVMNSFMGFLSGQYVRFIDTAVLGPVEIRIRLAPATILYGTDYSATSRPTAFNYKLTNMYMIMDTVTFTDDFYRALLAKRLQDGNVITIPYQNIFSFQKNITGTSDSVSFNLATQSLDYLVGTFRDQRYTANCVKRYSTDAVDTSYYKFTSAAGTNPINNISTYQFLVNNMYAPTWPANVNECAILSRNAWDMCNETLGFGRIDNMQKWRNGMFALVQSFNHHAEADKVISGLDTRGASSNMMFMVSNMIAATGTTPVVTAGNPNLGTYSAGMTDDFIYDIANHGAVNGVNCIVWALTTSTLEISAGQNIVVIF